MLTRPRKTRSGLGLLDSMLSIVVLSVLGIMMGNVISTWVEQRISQAEARVLSAWADAGEAWLLQNRGRIASDTSAPEVIKISATPTPEGIPTSDPLFASLTAFAPGQGPATTPHRRREITLWYRDAPGEDQVYLVAVASDGDSSLPAFRSLPAPRPHPDPVPGEGITNVGAISVAAGSAQGAGPGLEFDLAQWIAEKPGLAAPGDMVAVRAVSFDAATSPYLHRLKVDNHPELNRMGVDLDMDRKGITQAGRVTAVVLATPRVHGPLTVAGAVTVEGGLTVEGGGELTAPGAVFSGDLEVGTLTANSAVIEGEIFTKEATVQRLEVEGQCVGCSTP